MRDMAKHTVAALAAAATLLVGGCAGDQSSRRAEQPYTPPAREGTTYVAPSTDMDEGRATRAEERPRSQRGAKTTGEDREPFDDSRRGPCLSGVPGDPYGGAGLPGDQMGRGIDCPDWVEPKGTMPGTGPVH
jgi:hypothetical protein